MHDLLFLSVHFGAQFLGEYKDGRVLCTRSYSHELRCNYLTGQKAAGVTTIANVEAFVNGLAAFELSLPVRAFSARCKLENHLPHKEAALRRIMLGRA